MNNIFYYLGITVTKQMSGTARAVIAQVRKGENCSKSKVCKVISLDLQLIGTF